MPFIVLNPSPLHGPIIKKSDKEKGKKKADYMDVSDDQDENEDDEDDDDDEEDDWNHNEDEPAAPILKFGPLTKRN